MADKFISGREIIEVLKIEKYELMTLVRDGLRPWHPAFAEPIRSEIPSRLEGKVVFRPRDIKYRISGGEEGGIPLRVYDIGEIYPFLEECLFDRDDEALQKMRETGKEFIEQRSAEGGDDAITENPENWYVGRKEIIAYFHRLGFMKTDNLTNWSTVYRWAKQGKINLRHDANNRPFIIEKEVLSLKLAQSKKSGTKNIP